MQFARVNESFEFASANAIWTLQGLHIKQSYLDLLSEHYGMQPQSVDLKNNTEKARETINNWTNIQTNEKIKTVLSKNSLDSSSKIVLTSALYLKATWQHAFALQNTRNGDFTLSDETIVTTPMMHQKAIFRYKNVNGTDLLCMHYKNSDYRLLSIMPPKGEFESFENSLNVDSFRAMLVNPQTNEIKLDEKEIDLYYPKFKFENSINFKESLQQHGMIDPFSQNADFSPITEDARLNITNILQKTFFSVDEEGTEAAVSSAITIGTTHTAEMTLRFDRPFLFVLCHEPTKTILFLGRVINPQQMQ